jgi:RNA polymerase sigma-70 factor (ECF subfamily)
MNAIPTALTTNAEDEEIVAAILSGSTELFEIIVRRYSRRLLRVAISVLRNEAEAEDVVQDALVSAYQHLDQFAGRARFGTWITRIALYAALGRVSARPHESALHNDAGEEYPWLVYEGRNPEQSACQKQRLALLDAAIGSLPERYRRVVVMRDLHEFDTASTARELRLSVSNVKIRLHRAHAMLRKSVQRRMQRGPARGIQTKHSAALEPSPVHALPAHSVI